jgi:hypothetical protein
MGNRRSGNRNVKVSKDNTTNQGVSTKGNFFKRKLSKSKRGELIFFITIMCFGLLFTTTGVQKVYASSSKLKDGECLDVLREVASRIGAQGDEDIHYEYWNPKTGELIATYI